MICTGICRVPLTPESVAHFRRTLGRGGVARSLEPYSEVELLRLDLLIGERRLRRALGRRPTDLELMRWLLPGRSLWGYSLVELTDLQAPAR